MMPVLMLMRVPVIMTMIVVVIVRVAMIMRVSVIVGMAMTVRMAVAMFVDRLDAGGNGNLAPGLRIQRLAEGQHQGRSEEREQGNQPDGFEKIHVVPTTSASRF